MNDPLLALEKIEEILKQMGGWDFPLQLGAYAAVMHLINDLEKEAAGKPEIPSGLAGDFIVHLKESTGAICGLDVTNNLKTAHHLSRALGACDKLESLFKLRN